MFAEGTALGEILRRYPEAVPSQYRGKPVQPARRAIYAHYALLQEMQGEPDVNPADRATVEQLISEQGIEWARARTGSALTKYRNDWPDLSWYRSQAPERWTAEYEKLLSEKRGSDTRVDEDYPAAPGLGDTSVWSGDGAGGDETSAIPPDVAQTQACATAWSADAESDELAEDYPPTGCTPSPDERDAWNRLSYDPETNAWRDTRPWRDAFAVMAPWLFGAAVVAVVVAVVAYIWLQHNSRDSLASPTVQCEGTLTHTPTGIVCAPAAPTPPDTATVSHDCPTSECRKPPTADPPPPATAAAVQQLQEQARIDKPAVDALGGQWVPQLSSKQPGTHDDGIVYDDRAIWQEHSRLRQQYGAYLLWDNGDNGYWVTVASASFPDKQSAQAWCDRAGRDADHCFPRLIPAQQPVPAPPSPAAADPAPDAADRAFLAALRGAQITISDPFRAVFGGHYVCGQLASGFSRAAVAADVPSRNPAVTAIGAAQYAGE